MHEKHPGVQEMASKTFLKISQLTKHMFTKQNEQGQKAYVYDLINLIPDNCKDLEPIQKLRIYEGIGNMVSTEEVNQADLLLKLLQFSHAEWTEILMQANQNQNFLISADTIRVIDQIIKINQKVASSVGKVYIAYLS